MKLRRSSRSRSPPPRSNNSSSSSTSSSGTYFDSTPRTDRPEQYGVYEGEVLRIMDFGAFVELKGFPVKYEGLLHASAIRHGGSRVVPKDVLKQRQRVKVKVLTIVGDKIGLSMRDVDQVTGEDLRPIKRPTGPPSSSSSSSSFSSSGPAGGMGYAEAGSGVTANARVDNKKYSRRLTSPERWEQDLLIASGVRRPTSGSADGAAIASYHDDFDDGDSSGGEEVEVEMNEDEPAFLRGQTSSLLSSDDMAKVVKMPDGSLQRAALAQSGLAKERREMREQEHAQQLEAVPADLARSWADPMARAEDKHLAAELRGIGAANINTMPEWKRETMGMNMAFGKLTDKSIKQQREELPIFPLREEFLMAMKSNQIMVVVGATGSGKTTQMTQYLAEAGYGSNNKIIACTQPRRVAATSVAERVAQEVGCKLGEQVGYSVRFDDCCGPDTVIKYMTDGMLLRELLMDPTMDRYSVIILDEAHERTINTDVLFGLLKNAARKRPDLRLIVTSATLEADRFSDYFGRCSIFEIPGRLYDVDIRYAQQADPDYLDAAVITAMQIHFHEPPGDILIFLTGQEEIDTACETLYNRCQSLGKNAPPLLPMPVYASQPKDIQSKIFEPAPRGTRKCVVATNVAEASLTIDGIVYVIDPGFCKLKVYDPKLGMEKLQITPISQASAKQRAGRAGRTGPGVCFRLYTEQAYKTEMLPMTVPEIQRSNLASTVLTLKAMGINDLLGFDFMDPPPQAMMINALKSLHALSALDDEGLLTRLGRKMAEFPIDPPMAKILIASVDLGCAQEVLTVVAMLAGEEVFYRPKDKQAQSDSRRAKFHQPEGDHLMLLTVYEAWVKSKFSNTWCTDNFVSLKAMNAAHKVRQQLAAIMERYRLPIESCGKHVQRVCRAVTSGYFTNAAKKDPQEGYKTLVEGQPVYVHPSSSLFNKPPEWVLFHRLVLTSKEYMREVLCIDPKWLIELAPNFFKACDPNVISRRKKRERLEPLFNPHAVPNAWRLSKRKG